ncbi:MAG: PEGA domain-containing protein [Planctomycetes bacterium]|nr:PEGA domain-containing protein [Planctomycetota bacterium]
MKSAIIGCLCAIVILSAGCMRRDADRYGRKAPDPAVEAAAAAEAGRRIVVFAPLATGPLAQDYAEARLQFAYDLASRVDWLSKDLDGQAGEALPDSDADDWTKGQVPATAGAYLTVLTRVVEIKPIGGVSGIHDRRPTISATVEMKALDGDGRVVFLKKAMGQASGATTAKLMSDSSKPESMAAWDACSTAVGALLKYVQDRNDLASADADATITVDIDSEPARADIIIDGGFRGTTPQKVPLPVRVVTVRIERQGYQPWQRQLTPSEGMRIQPVLAKLGEPTPRSDAGQPGALTPAPMPRVDEPIGERAPAPDAGHAQDNGHDHGSSEAEPKPKRAEPMDDLTAPTPDTLVVPDGK